LPDPVVNVVEGPFDGEATSRTLNEIDAPVPAAALQDSLNEKVGNAPDCVLTFEPL
jgi:hypothetical protein